MHPASYAAAPSNSLLILGVEGFTFHDLWDPTELARLHEAFLRWFSVEAPEEAGKFDSYRAGKVTGAEATSDALLVAAPWVSRFVAKLFRVEKELDTLAQQTKDREPLWRFKRDFAKKRVLKNDAGRAWTTGMDAAHAVARAVVFALGGDELLRQDEELAVAHAVNRVFAVDDTARKVAKGGGGTWTDELLADAAKIREALKADDGAAKGLPAGFAEWNDGAVATMVLDAFEHWLARRRGIHHDPAHRWASLRAPKTLDFSNLVRLRRPDGSLPELFVGPEEERRERVGFALTDLRADARAVEEEIDYCLLCHERDKDSCSKGLKDAKTGSLKKNPLGVDLAGCPLEEKISEAHTMRRDGDALAALALIAIDNPMCPGTGHRICNDCMKGCVFQKQEPVNIPQIETRVLSEILALPYGLEIYGLLTRWNPLNIARPFPLPYTGKNVLVVGLGPAGYTLSHHLGREGFAVVAVDGLKIEPLPASLFDAAGRPAPVKDVQTLYAALDERVLLGFGGVSEYGITVRWDKNFLGVLYATLARQKSLRIHGGVRFGGTLTLDDAWELGFHHVALAAGAGRPTIIDMKNNLARGIRKASDFLMGLQLSGAFKKNSLANLQVSLPAVVVGGGLTAIDTATELLAYYPIQIEKTAARWKGIVATKGEAAARALFDDEEWETLSVHLAHARELEEERIRAAEEHRPVGLQKLLDGWGGVTLVYRKGLGDSPAYRLNHEEVEKSLEEGVRYVEHASPLEATLDRYGHVKGVIFQRKDGSTIELPARTVCVAAGTSPNVTYEREYPESFLMDERNQYFRTHEATLGENSEITLTPSKGKGAFFTSYRQGNKVVSFYGDNNPIYAGSVVKAMASAKDGYKYVAALFPENAKLSPAGQTIRDAERHAFFVKMQDLLHAEIVEVNRLTKTIVEVVVRAPLAARKFLPGQFYRLQNFESLAPEVPDLSGEGKVRLAMEGLALTGAWTDPERGLLGTIVLEMGGSSNLCAALAPGEPVVLMGPTGAPTEIEKETVLLCGGGLGNAVLFSIARAYKALGSKVIYFAGYKYGEDLFKQDDIEAHTDQVIWCTDAGAEIAPRRPQDAHLRGNIVQAMVRYAQGELVADFTKFKEVQRIIAIGSDRMMAAVREARHGVLQPLLSPKHLAIGSINSPMQCMMKEICAQCLQKHVDPVTGKESVVFTCYNQDQELDRVDFGHLRERLRANSMQEKLASAYMKELLIKSPNILRV